MTREYWKPGVVPHVLGVRDVGDEPALSLLQILLGVRHNLRLLGVRVQLHGVHHGQVGGEGAPVRGHLAHPDNIHQSEASIEVT